MQFKMCDPGELMQKMLSAAKECDRSHAAQVTVRFSSQIIYELLCSKLFNLFKTENLLC